MDILSRVFSVESAHMATLHAQSKKLSDLWALGALPGATSRAELAFSPSSEK